MHAKTLINETCTVAELIDVHSNFLKMEVVIFYAKFKDNNYP